MGSVIFGKDGGRGARLLTALQLWSGRRGAKLASLLIPFMFYTVQAPTADRASVTVILGKLT